MEIEITVAWVCILIDKLKPLVVTLTNVNDLHALGLNNSSIKQKSLVDKKNHIRRKELYIITSGNNGIFIKNKII